MRSGGAVARAGSSLARTRLLRLLVASAIIGCTAGCRTEIRAGLSEHDANRIVLALDRAMIAADKSRETAGAREPRYRIEVASTDAARAIAILQARELPGEPQRATVRGECEASLVPTLGEERERHRAAIESSLASSLQHFDGIVDARVHVALPHRQRQLDEPAPRPHASVLLRREAQAAPIDEDAIRALVAGAVEDLGAAQVTVVQQAVAAVDDPPRRLTQVGPIAVAPSSAQPLRLLLGGLLGLNLLLAIGVIALVRRGRRVR